MYDTPEVREHRAELLALLAEKAEELQLHRGAHRDAAARALKAGIARATDGRFYMTAPGCKGQDVVSWVADQRHIQDAAHLFRPAAAEPPRPPREQLKKMTAEQLLAFANGDRPITLKPRST